MNKAEALNETRAARERAVTSFARFSGRRVGEVERRERTRDCARGRGRGTREVDEDGKEVEVEVEDISVLIRMRGRR